MEEILNEIKRHCWRAIRMHDLDANLLHACLFFFLRCPLVWDLNFFPWIEDEQFCNSDAKQNCRICGLGENYVILHVFVFRYILLSGHPVVSEWEKNLQLILILNEISSCRMECWLVPSTSNFKQLWMTWLFTIYLKTNVKFTLIW